MPYHLHRILSCPIGLEGISSSNMLPYICMMRFISKVICCVQKYCTSVRSLLVFASSSSTKSNWGQELGLGDKSIQVPSGSEFHQYLSATKTAPTAWSNLTRYEMEWHHLTSVDATKKNGLNWFNVNLIHDWLAPTLLECFPIKVNGRSKDNQRDIICRHQSTRTLFVDCPPASNSQSSYLGYSLSIPEAVPRSIDSFCNWSITDHLPRHRHPWALWHKPFASSYSRSQYILRLEYIILK